MALKVSMENQLTRMAPSVAQRCGLEVWVVYARLAICK